MNTKNKKFRLFLLAAIIATIVVIIIGIISPTPIVYFGKTHTIFLIIGLTISMFLIVFLIVNSRDNFGSKQTKNLDEPYIQWNLENIKNLQQAKIAIGEAKPEKALKKLSEMRSFPLQEQITLLNSRLKEYKTKNIQGIQYREEKDVTINRIKKDILNLIVLLEQNQREGAEYADKIRKYLQGRYQTRLEQKLAGRQPVNLRKLPSTKGSTEDSSAAFVAYSSDEIRDGVHKIFRDSHGRLLIIGTPGAGKTTLLLQLELSLLEKESYAIPVILNLATWQKRFPYEDRFKNIPKEIKYWEEEQKKDEEWQKEWEDIQKEWGKEWEYPTMSDVIPGIIERLQQSFELYSETFENYKRNNNNFTSWNSWLETILPAELGVSSTLAKKIIEEYSLILLLDGFDEIPYYFREASLDAIGKYGSNSKHQYVITSRIEEYEKVTKNAPVHSQIEIGNLTDKQIINALEQTGYSQPEALPLLEAIRRSKILSECARTPFYFNTLQLLFANGKRLGDLNLSSDDVVKGQLEIKEKFIELILQYAKDKNYDKVSVERWLSFLAYKMDENNIVVFELTDLQYSWSNWSKKQLVTIHLFESVCRGVGEGIVIGLILGLITGKHQIIILGLITMGFFHICKQVYYQLLYNIAPPFIYTVDKFSFSLNFILKSIKANLRLGLDSILIRYSIYGLIAGLIYGSIVNDIDVIKIISIKTSLKHSLILGTVGGVILGILNIMMSNHYPFIQINKPYQRFIASAKNFYSMAILQHWHLLYLLHKKDVLPFRLVDFLNEMTENHLLESDGGTWRFRHRILQDYFADLWREEDEQMLEELKKNE